MVRWPTSIFLVLILFTDRALPASTCTIEPALPVSGELATIRYDPAGGPLAGAGQVYVHLGFNNWGQVAEKLPLVRDSQSGIWSYSYRVPEASFNINCAFHNGAGTWDNNSTKDWHFSVELALAPAELRPPPALPANASRAGVMMQGFYWDVPAGTWYGTLASKAAGLRNMASGQGIDRIWLPPPSKGESGPWSMGYDPFDYYDLGQYNQKGTIRTRFGTQAQLRDAIAAFREQGVVVMADIVLNHRSGGGWQYNPVSGQSYWTDFSGVASGRCTWDHHDFHPSAFEWSDEGAFAGFPDVCHVTGNAPGDPYYDLVAWGNWLMEPDNAGFDGGWRFDFVKGYSPYMIRGFREGTGNAFGIVECWDGIAMVDAYVRVCAGTSAFDFPGYYTLRDICNNPAGAGNIADLVNPSKTYAALRPERAVTFVANHDTDEITANKMLAYAFVLTYEGYPCLFWRDYFDRGLATLGGQAGNGIDALVWARGALAGGRPEIELLQAGHPDLLVYGTVQGSWRQPGYLVVLNDNPTNRMGVTVATSNPFLQGRALTCYAWYSHAPGQNARSPDTVCHASGEVAVEAPARGYALYGPKHIAFPESVAVSPGSITVKVANTLHGRRYTLYASADLANWQPEATFSGADSDQTSVPVVPGGRGRLYFRVMAAAEP